MEEEKGKVTPDNVTDEKTLENQPNEYNQVEDKDELIKNLYREISTLKGKKEHLEHKYERDVEKVKEEGTSIKQNEDGINPNSFKDVISEQIFLSQHKDIDNDVLSIIKKLRDVGQSYEEVFNSAPVQAVYREKQEKVEDKKATPKPSLGVSQSSGAGEGGIASDFRSKLNSRGLHI